MGSGDVSYEYDAASEIYRVQTYDPQSSVTRGTDGEGQQVRTVESEFKESSQSWTTTTRYYLRSRVLGGKVLTELAADGTKTRTFVYAGGTVLATQKFYGAAPAVEWEHRDPSEATFRTTTVNGDPWGTTELDPLGADAGTNAPLIEPNPPDDTGTSLVPYPAFMDAHNGLLRSYSIDGIPMPVDYFMRAFDDRFQGSFLGLAQFTIRHSLKQTSRNRSRVFPAEDENWSSGEVTDYKNNIWAAWSFAVSLRPQNSNAINYGPITLADFNLAGPLSDQNYGRCKVTFSTGDRECR